MNNEITLCRHPIAAALMLGALLAGCSQDNGPMYAQNTAPMYAQNTAPAQAYTEGPGMSQANPRERGANFAPGGSGAGSGGARFSGNPGRNADERFGNGGNEGRADRPGGFGREAAPNGGDDGLDQMMAWERQDAGVRPTRELHSGAMHGPTPNQIPGGQVITTKGLLPLLQQGIPVYVFDVLGAGQTLPNAIPVEWAAEPGSFEDRTQEQLAQMLEQATRGNANAPLVFYCQGPQCWMSYNAALRAIALGYRNVLWYRGGMEAWNRAGQRFAVRRG